MKNLIWKPRLLKSTNFLKKNSNILIRDEYRSQLKELFLLRNPQLRYNKNYKKEFTKFIKVHLNGVKDLKNKGSWFYFSWLKISVHILSEDLFLEMRTGRNRNLITKKEQNRFYNSTIAVAGLSVGSHVVATIAMNGGAKKIKIADPDTLSGSNLNRIRTGVQNIGVKKVVLAARQIFEINPYSEVEIYEDGLNENNINKFLKDADLLIEEMDNPYFKFVIREHAKKMGTPVIMATDNGDNIFVDIERYDLNKNMIIFNGLVKGINAKEIKNLKPQDLPRIAAKIAGAEIATTRMQRSVLGVGRTLYSWPQLGTAANLCGSVLTYLARNIINGYNNYNSGRYEVNLEAIFDEDYNKNERLRKVNTLKFLKNIGI